jgi:hypothetical protein
MGRSVHPVYYSNSNKKLYLNYDEKEPLFLARDGEWGRRCQFVPPDLMKPFPLSLLLSHLPAITNRQKKNPMRPSATKEKKHLLMYPFAIRG